ncbi:BC1872 family protein [Virgibacillus salexigens]|nr:hypothetical protein [Virgibacillus massiliensis]
MMDNRKIDQLVAEKVMGWEVIEYKNINTTVIDDGEFPVEIEEFKPSERIEHTWDVVEKLSEKCGVEVYQELGAPPYCKIISGAGKWIEYEAQNDSDTVPVVICKAALKTVGVEV